MKTKLNLNLHSTHHVKCIGSDGVLKWEEKKTNLVVDEGLYFVLECSFMDRDQEKWYCGMYESGVPSATDTMENHPGWVEFRGYTTARRPECIFYETPTREIHNILTSNECQFMIAKAGTVVGALLTTGESTITTDGILYGVSAFQTPHDVIVGDSLLVTITLGATS